MRRIRRIGSILSGDNKKSRRPICNDKFTLLPNEVHAALGSYLSTSDLGALCQVNHTLFKAYVSLYWKDITVSSISEVQVLNKLGKLIANRKTKHDYFAHIQVLTLDMWDEMDRGKDVAKLLDRTYRHLRKLSLNIGAAWGDEIQQAIANIPRTCYIELGVATKRLISLELYRATNIRSLELRLDFGNVGWLTPLSRSIEYLHVGPDYSIPLKRQLRFKDGDLKRTFQTAKYLRQLSLDCVCIQSDGSTTWIPPAVTDLTLRNVSFDIYCFDDYEDGENMDMVPVAENVTKLTVKSATDEDQIFMQFPRLHTLALVRDEMALDQPLNLSPIECKDMCNIQCLEFTGYTYEEILSIVSASMDRLPASTLRINQVPNNGSTAWYPSSNKIFDDILDQLPSLIRVYLDCTPLQHVDVPFSKELRVAIMDLIMGHEINTRSQSRTEMVIDLGKNDGGELFQQVCFAGGIEIQLEETPEPPLQRIASVQGNPVPGIVLVV